MYNEEVIERIIEGERRNVGKKQYDNLSLREHQQKTLRKYHKHLVGHGRPLSTRIAYLRILVKFTQILNAKRFEDVTREDFSEFMYSMRDLEPNTIQSNYNALHGFYKWLGGFTKDEEQYIRNLRKERYKPAAKNKQVIKGEDLPSREEIEQIIKYAPSTRDKAIFAMMYDLGTRPHELFNLNVGDVHFDEYGVVVSVTGKTGTRTLRLITSLPYLREWLEAHPLRDKKDAPLFCRTDHKDFGGRLEPAALRKLLIKSAGYAGIDKKVYAYLLRHASITRSAGELTDQQLKSFYGWTPSSTMLGVYSHLRSEDVNTKRLEQAGIVKPKVNVHELKFRKCPRCGDENPPTHEFCSKCSSPLDEERYRALLSNEADVEALKQKYDAKLAEVEKALEKLVNSLKT